jgi:hypothetical protein
MTAPTPPTGYDVSKRVDAGRSDCHITVGFDRERGYIPRFLVQLHYQVDTDPVQWDAIARMDHNETDPLGHDVYQEGLHVDVVRRSAGTVHLEIRHGALAVNRGMVVRRCVDYFKREAAYFIDVYEGRISPGGPPRWSDGGDLPHTLIRENHQIEGMSEERPADDEVLSMDELDEVLAEATGTTAEEIRQGAEEIYIAPPEEATVVDE